jgi:hypothetical protein
MVGAKVCLLLTFLAFHLEEAERARRASGDDGGDPPVSGVGKLVY